jgi:hypothetical protein
MDINKLNRVISYLLLLINAIIVPITLSTLINGKSFMGYGLSGIVYSLPIHVLIITSLLALKIEFRKNRILLILNLFGLIYALIILTLLTIIYFGSQECIA